MISLCKNLSELVEQDEAAFTKIGWEGDYTNGAFYFSLPTDYQMAIGYIWSLCLKTLHKEDQTIVRQDGKRGLYSVVTLATAANEALPSDTLELEGLMPGYQSVIIPLQRVQPEEMAERITSIVKPSNAIGIEAIEGLDGVVVRGVIERVKVVVDLVRRFDAESSESGMVVVDVVNRTALEVVAEVNAIISALAQHNNESLESSLIASSGGQSIRVYGPIAEQQRIRSLIEEADRKAAIETRVFDPRGYPLETVAQFIETMAKDETGRGSGESWRVAQDTLTSTLIVTGTLARQTRGCSREQWETA